MKQEQSEENAGTIFSLEEITLKDKIGEGAHGEVFKAVWSGKLVAAKRIRTQFFDGSMRAASLEKLKSEWAIIRNLKHPNVVEHYAMILPPSPETPIIVTELLDCDLQKHLLLIRESESKQPGSKPKMPFADVVEISLNVAEGLRYLHSLEPPIVHRDVASKNVLLTKSLRAKIADFGVARVFRHGAMFATPLPGSLVYAAPETYPKNSGGNQWPQKVKYTEKIDIFSFGAVMLEMIIGYLRKPILPILESGVLEYIRRKEELEEIGPDHPLRNLVFHCLENIPAKRPSAAKIVETLRTLSKTVEEKISYSSAGDKLQDETSPGLRAQQLPDDDGGNVSKKQSQEEEVNDGNGDNVGEEVTGGEEQLSQQLHEIQLEEQQHLLEEAANKIRLHEKILLVGLPKERPTSRYSRI